MLVNDHVGAAWNVWGTPKCNDIDPIVSQLYTHTPPSVDLLRCVDCRFLNSTLKFLHAVNTVTVDCPFLGVLRRNGCHFYCTCFTECVYILLVSDHFKKSPCYIVISDARQWYTTDQSHCFIITVNGWIDYCRIRCISKYYIIPYACMFS